MSVNPSTPRRKTWVIRSAGGVTATGHLPEWADEDPSTDGLTPVEFDNHLSDLCHRRDFGGLPVNIWHPASGADVPSPTGILAFHIACSPHVATIPPQPLAAIQIVDDYNVVDLDPDGVRHFAMGLRKMADVLDREVVPALVAAREDWAVHHATTPPAEMEPPCASS
jgi:hypothetical protein